MSIKYADINVGDTMPVYTSAPLTRTDIVRYASASGDFNPLHHDNTFANAVGMERNIAHGMLIMGIAGEAVRAWIDQKNLRKFNARFIGKTEPADRDDFENTKKRATITVTGQVTNKFEENGEKRIQCDIEAKDGLGGTKIRGFFIASVT
jgi:acyl dehydratase